MFRFTCLSQQEIGASFSDASRLAEAHASRGVLSRPGGAVTIFAPASGREIAGLLSPSGVAIKAGVKAGRPGATGLRGYATDPIELQLCRRVISAAGA